MHQMLFGGRAPLQPARGWRGVKINEVSGKERERGGTGGEKGKEEKESCTYPEKLSKVGTYVLEF